MAIPFPSVRFHSVRGLLSAIIAVGLLPWVGCGDSEPSRVVVVVPDVQQPAEGGASGDLDGAVAENAVAPPGEEPGNGSVDLGTPSDGGAENSSNEFASAETSLSSGDSPTLDSSLSSEPASNFGEGAGLQGASPSGESPADVAARFTELLAAKEKTDSEATGPKLPKDYLGQAQLAYSFGAEIKAYQLFLAHLAAEPDRAMPAYQKAVFSDLLKKPVWNLKWGLGTSVDRRDYDGYAFPPQEDMKLPVVKTDGTGANIESNPAPESAGSTPNALTSAEPGMEDLTAVFGMVPASLKAMFSVRYTRGDFGSGLASMPQIATAPEQAQPAAKSAGSEASAEMLADGMPNFATEQKKQPESEAPAIMVSPEAPRFTNGVFYVGPGKRDELLDKATALGLDFLFQFESRIDRNRANGAVTNQIQVKLYRVSSKEVLATSKPISNIEIYKALNPPGQNVTKKKTAAEIVDDALNNIFLVVDNRIKCRPMPKLPPEVVRSRIASLIVARPEDRLASLAEIRMYHAQGSLSDAELEQVIFMLLGEPGLQLLVGSQEKQHEVLDVWAQRLSGS